MKNNGISHEHLGGYLTCFVIMYLYLYIYMYPYLCYWHSHSEQSLVLFNLGQYYCIILMLKYFTVANTKKRLSASCFNFFQVLMDWQTPGTS